MNPEMSSLTSEQLAALRGGGLLSAISDFVDHLMIEIVMDFFRDLGALLGVSI